MEGNDDNFGIEVVLIPDDNQVPCCPHGPTLLFEKVSREGPTGRRFYACSACRDRKDCSFFQWEDDKVSESRQLARETENKLHRPKISHKEYCTRFKKFTSLSSDDKIFCKECQTLLLPVERDAHLSHKRMVVTAAELRRPSVLLSPMNNKKSNAQYLFTDRSANFLLDTLAALGFTKVLCVGTPRLQEMIRLRNLQQNNKPMKSLLLDIDYRYAQFYSQDEFCHYNMFNHHFFGGKGSSSVVQSFLKESDGEKVVMVADPPFGGLVKPLARSFSLISQTWKKMQGDVIDTDIPMLWVFPYFFEPRIQECLPTLAMLDYQVDYDNHPLYKHGKTGRKQSPVRLFTNICPKDVVLPKSEGYRFCSMCQRFVCSLNKHCGKCDICPSKDGREWKHCSTCEKCVKPSWSHCQTCERCALPDHPCGLSGAKQGCFSCGSLQHKHRFCTVRQKLKSSGYRSNAKSGARKLSHDPPRRPKAKRKSGAARRAKKMAAQSA